jgi:uncharacterized protein (TIGR03437 family)
MARSIVLFVLILAAAFAATAQSQQPFLTMTIPAAPDGGFQVPVMLSDLNHNAVQVVYPDSILTVRTDGTTSSYALPVTAANFTSDGSGRYGIIACVSANGHVAIVAQDPSAGNDATNLLTNVQVIDTVGGTAQELSIKYAASGSPRACAFGKKDGLLYIGAEIPHSNLTRTSPGFITIDPATMQVVQSQLTGENNTVDSMVATQNGVYTFNQNLTQSCAAANNCTTSLGKIGSDGTYQVLYQTTMGLTTTPVTSAPNGNIFAGGKTFDQNGQPITTMNGLGLFTSVAFPSLDSGYAYKAFPGFFGGVNIASNLVAINLTTTTSSQYFTVAAQRQSDGNDLVVAERNRFLDFYRVIPPQMMSNIANAGSLQPGPLAAGSIITIFGQTLGSWGESDVADGTKVVTKLGSTQVFLDGNFGNPIRLLYVGYGQVNAILPSNLPVGDQHWLTVQNGSTKVTRSITIADQTLAAFMWAPDPANQTTVAPILTDGSYCLLGNPALSPAYAQANPGDTITLWATGGGRTSPALDDSIVAVPTDSLYYLTLTPQVLVDGNAAIVTYAGLVPQSVPGLDQINFVVPGGLAPGPHDFQVNDRVYRGGLWIK